MESYFDYFKTPYVDINLLMQKYQGNWKQNFKTPYVDINPK